MTKTGEHPYWVASNGTVHKAGCDHANRLRVLFDTVTLDDAVTTAKGEDLSGRIAPCAKSTKVTTPTQENTTMTDTTTTPDTKQCPSCGETTPATPEFWSFVKGTIWNRCRACEKAYDTMYRLTKQVTVKPDDTDLATKLDTAKQVWEARRAGAVRTRKVKADEPAVDGTTVQSEEIAKLDQHLADVGVGSDEGQRALAEAAAQAKAARLARKNELQRARRAAAKVARS